MTVCKKHPRYKAMLQPRCKCPVCWAIWMAKKKTVLKEKLKSISENQPNAQ